VVGEVARVAAGSGVVTEGGVVFEL